MRDGDDDSTPTPAQYAAHHTSRSERLRLIIRQLPPPGLVTRRYQSLSAAIGYGSHYWLLLRYVTIVRYGWVVTRAVTAVARHHGRHCSTTGTTIQYHVTGVSMAVRYRIPSTQQRYVMLSPRDNMNTRIHMAEYRMKFNGYCVMSLGEYR